MYTGQLKFSVRLDRWPWATSGQYVDVDVIMKVPPGRAMRKKASKGRGHPVGFELGADAAAFFPNKVGKTSRLFFAFGLINTKLGVVGVDDSSLQRSFLLRSVGT